MRQKVSDSAARKPERTVPHLHETQREEPSSGVPPFTRMVTMTLSFSKKRDASGIAMRLNDQFIAGVANAQDECGKSSSYRGKRPKSVLLKRSNMQVKREIGR